MRYCPVFVLRALFAAREFVPRPRNVIFTVVVRRFFVSVPRGQINNKRTLENIERDSSSNICRVRLSREKNPLYIRKLSRGDAERDVIFVEPVDRSRSIIVVV